MRGLHGSSLAPACGRSTSQSSDFVDCRLPPYIGFRFQFPATQLNCHLDSRFSPLSKCSVGPAATVIVIGLQLLRNDVSELSYIILLISRLIWRLAAYRWLRLRCEVWDFCKSKEIKGYEKVYFLNFAYLLLCKYILTSYSHHEIMCSYYC